MAKSLRHRLSHELVPDAPVLKVMKAFSPRKNNDGKKRYAAGGAACFGDIRNGDRVTMRSGDVREVPIVTVRRMMAMKKAPVFVIPGSQVLGGLVTDPKLPNIDVDPEPEPQPGPLPNRPKPVIIG